MDWLKNLEKSMGGYAWLPFKKKRKNPNPILDAIETNSNLIRIAIFLGVCMLLMGVLILTQTGVVGAVLRAGVC